MNHRLLHIKIIAVFLMMQYFLGCTSKVPIRTWVPPQSAADNIAAKVDYLIIVNPHKGELLYDIFENALRERFTILPFLEVESSFGTAEIALKLKNYNYIPRLPNKERVAYLSFEIKENHQLQRSQNTRGVNLHRCNNLIKSKKQQRCRIYAKETLKQGVQNLRYSQQVLFNLSDDNGNTIIERQQIERVYQIRNKLIPDEIILRKKLSDLIAREYSKLVLPFRKNIEVELLDGDAIAKQMLEKGAYSQAFKRLEKLQNKQNGTKISVENKYLQGLSLEFQSDLVGALSYYREALLLESANEVVQAAVSRIKAAITVKTKST
jgi:hypothetical protein